MSLNLAADMSSVDAHAVDPAVMEEDYCLHAVHRFRQQWMQHHTFQPAALRHYGVRGDTTLTRSLMQRTSFGAAFGTFTLGDMRDFAPPGATPPSPHWVAARGVNGDFDTPMGSVLLGPAADPLQRRSLSPEQCLATRDELTRSWMALTHPSSWSPTMCAVLTIAGWATVAQRERARHQLQLASFMGVKAVQVPLPMLVAGRWESTVGDPAWAAARGVEGATAALPAVTPEAYAEANWQLLGEVAEMLAAYVAGADGGPQVWVRCDACYPLQRRQFHDLRSLVLYGCARDPVTGRVTGPLPATTHTACDVMRRETVHAMVPLLYFSNPHGLATFSTEWLGEDVPAFEVPPADLMLRDLQPREAGRWVGGTGEVEATAESTMGNSRAEYDFDEEDRDADLYSLPGLARSQGDVHEVAAPHTSTPHPATERESPNGQQRPPGARHRHCWQLPEDLLPPTASLWGGHYPARVSLLTLVVELMRRRAAPIFSHLFFDHYAIMNYLFASAVVDSTRERFISYEDVLQLPLQPLGHQLSSGVYEVFERDASKYRQYREAFYAYTLDWVNARAETGHHGVRCRAFAHANTPLAGEGSGMDTMYVVLLGCGRGPLIDEILSAASSLSVRVRLFAVEKNAPAAAFTELRRRCDPEWQHLFAAFGHTLCTIVADGRTVYDRREELRLPPDFGLCDVIVSELLGSFGDNELSPECIEGFVAQLRLLQEERHAEGLSFNPNMVSIPESYTAWAAPVHAVRLEQAVADAAMKGLTVRPPGCPDRYAALFHSPFVCNVTRAVLLAPPQRCWTFRHSWAAEERPAGAGGRSERRSKGTASAKRESHKPSAGSAAAAAVAVSPAANPFERQASLEFSIAPQGRCSAFAGFFSAILYTPRGTAEAAQSPGAVEADNIPRAITLATAPGSGSRAPAERRTPDMYSWFPCYLPLDPSQVRDIPVADEYVARAVVGGSEEQSKSAQTTVTLEIGRHVDLASRRAWYSWRVGYGDGTRSVDAEASEERRTRAFSNEGGWAAAMYL